MIVKCRGYTGLVHSMIFHYPSDEHDWNDQSQTYEIKLAYDITIALIQNGGGTAGAIVSLDEVEPEEIEAINAKHAD